MKTVETLIVTFDKYLLLPDEMPKFRSFIQKMDKQNSLFHNHGLVGGASFRYPAIQYRIYQGKATLFGVNEGANAIEKLMNKNLASLMPYFEGLPKLRIHTTEVMLTDQPFRYQLRQWLPLNRYKNQSGELIDNHKKWQQLTGIVEKAQFLERILIGHLLNFCSAVGFFAKGDIIVKLIDYTDNGELDYPNDDADDIRYRSFDLIYESNLHLPDYIGLGKGKSKGFGWQNRSEKVYL